MRPGSPRPTRTSPTGSEAASTRRAAPELGGPAAAPWRRDLRRQQPRLALLPRPLEPVGRDLQLHREGDDRLADGAPDHRRRDRPLGRRHHRPGLDRHGRGRRRPAPAAGPGRRRPRWSGSLRRCSTAARHPLRPAGDRRHHRHDEPVPRHRLHRPRRPGLPQISRRASPTSARAMSGGSCPSSSCCSLVLALAFGVLLHWTSFGRRVYAIGNNPTRRCSPASASPA